MLEAISKICFKWQPVPVIIGISKAISSYQIGFDKLNLTLEGIFEIAPNL